MEIFINALHATLRALARLTLARFKPTVIGVTGSVGKTSAKAAIWLALRRGAPDRTVRGSKGNLNTDFGLPLTIVGDFRDEELALVSRATPLHTRRLRKALFWAKVLFGGTWRLVAGRKSSYPEILILEYGADHPGDIKRLLEIARPQHAVITAVGETPVHLEFYESAKEVAREKARLIERLPVAGYAILNADDPMIMDLKDRTGAHVLTFGFSPSADVHITRFEHRKQSGVPVGISFKIEYGGSFVPVRQDGVFGKAAAYAAAAGAAAGLIFGMNLVTISEALNRYEPVHSRMEILSGLKESVVIDDTYNASPLSVGSALEALGELPALRKIAILGDMLELGTHTESAHRAVGKHAAGVADVLITVGEHSKFVAEEARKAGLEKRRIHSFRTSNDAAEFAVKLLKKGDLVLVKGSRGIALENVVNEIRTPPSSSPA